MTFAVTGLTGCTQKQVVQKKIHITRPSITPPKPVGVPNAEAPNITVWIHGTKGFGKISDFVHATPKPGLLPLSSVSPLYRLSALMKSLSDTDPNQFPLEQCYVYGWSGALSFEARKKEAGDLFTALKLLVAEYQTKFDVKPRLTIITHSHGGNVLLNLARAKDHQEEFSIDKAILLACPVQIETKNLVKDPMFKKIYSFYSALDMLQIMDPQGLYLTENNQNRHLEFSEREFPIHGTLRQAQLKINGHGLMHLGFITTSFVTLLPALMCEVEQWELEAPSNPDEERLLSVTV